MWAGRYEVLPFLLGLWQLVPALKKLIQLNHFTHTSSPALHPRNLILYIVYMTQPIILCAVSELCVYSELVLVWWITIPGPPLVCWHGYCGRLCLRQTNVFMAVELFFVYKLGRFHVSQCSSWFRTLFLSCRPAMLLQLTPLVWS